MTSCVFLCELFIYLSFFFFSLPLLLLGVFYTPPTNSLLLAPCCPRPPNLGVQRLLPGVVLCPQSCLVKGAFSLQNIATLLKLSSQRREQRTTSRPCTCARECVFVSMCKRLWVRGELKEAQGALSRASLPIHPHPLLQPYQLCFCFSCCLYSFSRCSRITPFPFVSVLCL